MLKNVASSTLEDMSERCGVPRLFVAHNEPLKRLLFDRNTTGIDFRTTCLEASQLMFRHLADDRDDQCAELLILSKGLVYQLAPAVALETGKNLPVNLIATSRTAVSATDAEIEATYSRFDAGGSRLLIGDTVASGATIMRALDEYQRSNAVQQIDILSYAGTRIGASRISDYCRQRGVAVTFLFGLAVFGLGRNGFDLSFLHPDTVTKDEYRQRAARQFGGKEVSCVGWDFGSQTMAPDKYRKLCWLEAEVWDLHNRECLAQARPPADEADWAQLRHEAAAYRRSHPDAIYRPLATY
jgi:hypothetical protein